jgi:hypothetical protein
MFYNSKKLIDEKVLQQYFFERFMLADASARKKLLPPTHHQWAASTSLKGLNPEVAVGRDEKGRQHVTDFVLYPMPNSELHPLNIELKWCIDDFQKQKSRFPFYDGRAGRGYVVALKTKEEEPLEVGEPGRPIPAVYLDPEPFKRWFSMNAHAIVAQALANKIGTPPERLTGPRYWVVCIVKSSESHYLDHGRPNLIWAFRDRNLPERIMQILQGDYVVFVRLAHCKPGRMIYPVPKSPTKEYELSRGGTVVSTEIDWAIGRVDAYKIRQGYHLNYTDKSPYHGFDEAWMESSERRPQDKDYTQFIRMEKNAGDDYEYTWNRPGGTVLPRSLFAESDRGLSQFVDAVRYSMNTQGDAREISETSFNALLRLLGRY